MSNKKRTAYSLGNEENSFSPLLKLNEKDRAEWFTLGGADSEGSGGEEVMMEATVEPEGRDTYDQLGIQPQMMQTGAKKTTVVNFKDICRLLRCQPKPLLTFLSIELGGVTASLDSNNRLVLKGKIQQKHVEQALRKYFKEYVECHICRSPKTVHQKEENGLYCETCHSRSVAAGIKVTVKDNMDSLDPNVTKKKKTKSKKKKHAKSHTSIWIFFYILLFILALAGALTISVAFDAVNGGQT